MSASGFCLTFRVCSSLFTVLLRQITAPLIISLRDLPVRGENLFSAITDDAADILKGEIYQSFLLVASCVSVVRELQKTVHTMNYEVLIFVY